MVAGHDYLEATLHARQTHYSGIVGTGRTLHVPAYQRNYRWDRGDLTILWLDILAQYKELMDFEELDEAHRKKLYTTVGNHYMGTVVLAKHDDSETDYDVIDGQQRITTLSLLLAALRENWYPLPKSSGKSIANPEPGLLELRNNYNTTNLVNPSDEIAGKSSPRLRPHLRDRLAFDEVIGFKGDKKLDAKQLGVKDTLILNAFKFFHDEMRKSKDKASKDPQLMSYVDCYPIRNKLLRDVITTRLRFVEVTTESIDDANAIFESLNGKGRNLDPIDLLKNYLYMTLRDDEKTTETFWSPIIQVLGTQEVLAKFLWADMVSRGNSVSQRKLYSAKKQEISALIAEGDGSRDAVWTELTRLRGEAANYLAVSEPSRYKRSTPQVGSALTDVQAAGGSTAVPLLLFLLREQDRVDAPDTDVIDAIRLVESYLVRRFLCGLDSHNLNSYFTAMLAKAHEKQKEDAWKDLKLPERAALILDTVPDNWPTDETASKRLTTVDIYQSGETAQRMLIFKRLDVAAGQEYKISYTDTDLTVEHILPKNADKAGWWDSALKEQNQAFTQVQSESLHSLANLVPLLRTENSGIGNGPYPDKCSLYAKSKLELTRLVAKHFKDRPVWGRDELVQFAKILEPLVAEAWPRPVTTSSAQSDASLSVGGAVGDDSADGADDLVVVEDDPYFESAPPTTDGEEPRVL